MNFQRLPRLLDKLAEWSNDYQDYAEHMKHDAEIYNCSADQLHVDRDWPEIKW